MDDETVTMGRPQIGPMINFRLSEQDLAAVDAAATARQLTRAAWLRETVARRLLMPHEDLPKFMRWMLANGLDTEDLIRMVKKPRKYELEYLIFKTGYPADLDEVYHRDDVDTKALLKQLRAQLASRARLV